MRRLWQCLAIGILLVLPAHAQQRVDAEVPPFDPSKPFAIVTPSVATWLPEGYDETFTRELYVNTLPEAQGAEVTQPSAQPSTAADEASRLLARAWLGVALTPSPDCATSERFYLALVQYIETHPEGYRDPDATIRDARTSRDANCGQGRSLAAAWAEYRHTIDAGLGDAAIAASWARYEAIADPGAQARADLARARYEAAHARLEALKAEIAAEQAAAGRLRTRLLLSASSPIPAPRLALPSAYVPTPLEIVTRAQPRSRSMLGGSFRPRGIVTYEPLQPQLAGQPPLLARPPIAGPPSLVGEDGVYLGTLSSNPYDPNSISNPYGRYGSRYSPDSIKNPYGMYGSRYSPYSATNPYTTQAPKIVNPYLGRLSANPYAPDSTSNRYGPYGSPYSRSSIMNPYGPYGSPFSPSSVTNPYAVAPLPPFAPLIPLTGR